MVADLEAVVDAARLDRFALLGCCQGGAVSIMYAARHPERVSHLVLFGAYARGPLRRNPSLKQAEAIQAQLKLIEHGWGREQDAFRQIFTSQLFPRASAAEQHAFNEIQRTVCAPNEAARLAGAFFELDASPCLARVSCPTLVLHARGDQFVPFDAEALFIAASIADARLQTLDTDAHVPLAEDPAFAQALTALDSFLPRRRIEVAPPEIATLTRRERQVLALVARGLDNSEIAVQLVLAEKTVRNNITSIFDKISVKSRAQAMLSAMRAGLVGTPGAIDSDHPDRSPLFYVSQPAIGTTVPSFPEQSA